LGKNNDVGEWTIAYHGTPHINVKSIASSALRAGSNNAYGKGIYCYPFVEEAARHCGQPLVLKAKNGSVGLNYVFMCRVNVSRPHHCLQTPCPLSEDPSYTVHFTTNCNLWFVNLNNSNYENIRQYGILVKEI
jgi:hypothetical protein